MGWPFRDAAKEKSPATLREVVAGVSGRSSGREVTLYLNGDGVQRAYDMRFSSVEQLVFSEELSSQITATIAGLVGLGGTRRHGLATHVRVSPTLMAVLLEAAHEREGSLIDPSEGAPLAAGQLLRYVGPSKLFGRDEAVSSDGAPISPEEAEAIEAERQQQQRDLQLAGPDVQTVLWTAATSTRPLAAIASTQWLDIGPYASHHRDGSFGLLGRLERELDGVAFLAPLWIWQE